MHTFPLDLFFVNIFLKYSNIRFHSACDKMRNRKNYVLEPGVIWSDVADFEIRSITARKVSKYGVFSGPYLDTFYIVHFLIKNILF